MLIKWPYNEIILTKMKSLKCNEPISLLRSHSDLGQCTEPHFCTSACDLNTWHEYEKIDICLEEDFCRNLNLGLATKVEAYEGVG
jgi:hypothetical protein